MLGRLSCLFGFRPVPPEKNQGPPKIMEKHHECPPVALRGHHLPLELRRANSTSPLWSACGEDLFWRKAMMRRVCCFFYGAKTWELNKKNLEVEQFFEDFIVIYIFLNPITVSRTGCLSIRDYLRYTKYWKSSGKNGRESEKDLTAEG